MRPLLFSVTHLSVLSVFAFFAVLAPLARADLTSSTNYQVQQVITSGGSRGSSTDYQGESSIGQPATGISSSTSFFLKGGFLYFGVPPAVQNNGGGGNIGGGGGGPAPSPGSGGGGGGSGYITALIKKLFPKSGCSVNSIDFNGDGKVNIVDLSILLFYYNDKGSDLGCFDLDGNGVVDFPDISILMYYWTG